jgi:hypothetical protein
MALALTLLSALSVVALRALLARHRSAEVEASYATYDGSASARAHPLTAMLPWLPHRSLVGDGQLLADA